MTKPAHDANPRWPGFLLAALVAVLVMLIGAGTASAAAATAAQTRVGAHTLVAQVVVGPGCGIGAGQRLGNDPPAYDFALATGVAAKAAVPMERALTSVDDVLGGLARGSNAGVRTVGSEAELQSTFGTLTRGGSPTEWTGYKGTVIQRSDGVEVGLRSGSKSGGSTIDVRMLDGTMQKVHVG